MTLTPCRVAGYIISVRRTYSCTHVLTYLHTYLLTYLLTYLHSWLGRIKPSISPKRLKIERKLLLLYCKFPGECDSERILKIGHYLTKLCVDYVGLLFLAHPVRLYVFLDVFRPIFNKVIIKDLTIITSKASALLYEILQFKN